MIYQTKEEAQKQADRENMGADYSFYYVIEVESGYKVAVK